MINCYVKSGKIPPKHPSEISTPESLIKRLEPLIGTTFELTGKTRTDGSNFRKLITKTLLQEFTPQGADENSYSILPPKQKGVPKFLREYIDTYIVTSGKKYNLQVWNRNPNNPFVQVQYKNGENLLATDVRFILGKVNITTNVIESIIIMTPDYIVKNFGEFGKPTSKQQLIISNESRKLIINSNNKLLFEEDHKSLNGSLQENCIIAPNASIKDTPTKVIKLSTLKNLLVKELIGIRLDPLKSTKERGQDLERIICKKLGYTVNDCSLDGGYPDIKNQMLEVKVQESPTIDLGKFSPQFIETISGDFTTENIRYLIALTKPKTGEIEGIILCPGASLGKYFTYVAEQSFKCQRSIPMEYFESFKDQVVFNPSI